MKQGTLFYPAEDKPKKPRKRTRWNKGSGVKRRNEGVTAAMVAERAEWRATAMRVICALPVGSVVIAEDFRQEIVEKVGEPHHSAVWGALTRTAVGAGLLEPTGKLRKSQKPSNHARLAQEYVVAGVV